MLKPVFHHFILEGKPIPYAAHHTHGAIHYDPQKELKDTLSWELKAQYTKTTISSPVRLSVIYYFPIPQSKQAKFKREPTKIHYQSVKPDIDNCTKMLLDILQRSCILLNDSQVCQLNATKLYDTHPRTEFTITLLGESSEVL